MWRRIVLLSVLSACLWLVQSQQPTPPVIADPCYVRQPSHTSEKVQDTLFNFWICAIVHTDAFISCK